MNLPAGNHPCKSFFANQDESPRWKSSLQELFCISGCISPAGIIPARHFLQIRMNLPTGNHPCKTFPANQDQFSPWKSSLQELFCKSGSISPPKIIPPRAFLQFRINFPAGNHPCKTFPANQDESPHWKSSLYDNSTESGCISPAGFIPARAFLQIRMNLPTGNHPSQTFPANQDESPH